MSKIDPSWVGVIWHGKMPLIPDREERLDDRYAGMPTYNIDDGDTPDVKPHRRYVYTGKFKRAKKVEVESSQPPDGTDIALLEGINPAVGDEHGNQS